MIRYRLLILNALLLLTLLGSHLGRRIESASFAHADFLQELRLPFRNWKTTEESLSPEELKLLEPDATLIRRYEAPNHGWAQLAVIAGHRKKSVHTPGFCMAGGGWDTLTQQECTLALPGRSIRATRALMSKDGHQLLVTYFFTDGAYCTNNLVQFQGVQMFKRFRAEVPLGALVRILIPVVTDQAEAEQTSDEFVQAMLPGTLDALRDTHLSPRRL